MNLGKLGSTSAKSNIFLAFKSFATVKPSVCDALYGFCPAGNDTEVDPVSPVYAVPPKAAMITSSIALPIAAAAAFA